MSVATTKFVNDEEQFSVDLLKGKISEFALHLELLFNPRNLTHFGITDRFDEYVIEHMEKYDPLKDFKLVLDSIVRKMIEVKIEPTAAKSQKSFWEYLGNTGAPSGLDITEADFYVIISGSYRGIGVDPITGIGFDPYSRVIPVSKMKAMPSYINNQGVRGYKGSMGKLITLKEIDETLAPTRLKVNENTLKLLPYASTKGIPLEVMGEVYTETEFEVALELLKYYPKLVKRVE